MLGFEAAAAPLPESYHSKLSLVLPLKRVSNANYLHRNTERQKAIWWMPGAEDRRKLGATAYWLQRGAWGGFFWVMKMLWNRLITQPCEWTTGYEMFTFTWLVWCYVNFISKGKKKIRMAIRDLTGWERGAHFVPMSWWMDAKRTFTHLVYWYREPEDAGINSASVVREAFTKVSIWAKP